MVYSDVIKNNLHLILPKKNKYTKRDVDKIIIKSLFNKTLNSGNTFTEKQAKFIVKCIAIYHNTDYSKYVSIPVKNNLYPVMEV